MMQDHISQREYIHLVDLKYNITYQNIRGKLRSDQFLCPEKPKMAKKSYLKLTWMSFLRNRKVCFKGESLPITYHNYHHKVWSDLEVKLTRISTHKLINKLNFSQRDQLCLEDQKKKKKRKENSPKYLVEK